METRGFRGWAATLPRALAPSVFGKTTSVYLLLGFLIIFSIRAVESCDKSILLLPSFAEGRVPTTIFYVTQNGYRENYCRSYLRVSSADRHKQRTRE